MKNKIRSIFWDMAREYALNKLCNTYTINSGGILALNIISGLNPIDMAIRIIALKLGVNPIILGLVLVFLL